MNDNVIQIIVAGQALFAREDRLKAFYNSLKCFCLHEERTDWDMGVDGGAVIGLNAIFSYIPQKFPVVELIRFLAEDYTSSTTYKTNMAAVEYHLVKFGQKYPGIYGNGEDVQ